MRRGGAGIEGREEGGTGYRRVSEGGGSRVGKREGRGDERWDEGRAAHTAGRRIWV